MAEVTNPRLIAIIADIDGEITKVKTKLDGDEKKARDKFEAEMQKLAPVRREFEELMTAKNNLLGVSPSRKTTTTARRQTGARTARGTRMEQFMSAVVANPGQKAADYARLMDMEPTYVYRVRKQALAANKIKVEDGKVFPADDGDDAAIAARVKQLEGQMAGAGATS